MDHRNRFGTARVARLATVRGDGSPHIVPITFALVDDTVFQAIDHKPKRSVHLQRVSNLESEPRCSLLVDHYDDDWQRLWWVRADGLGRVVATDEEARHALDALAAKYPDYRIRRPEGPVLAFDIVRWSGWESVGGG